MTGFTGRREFCRHMIWIGSGIIGRYVAAHAGRWNGCITRRVTGIATCASLILMMGIPVTRSSYA